MILRIMWNFLNQFSKNFRPMGITVYFKNYVKHVCKIVDFGKFSPFVKSNPPFVKSLLFFLNSIPIFVT